MTNVELLKAVRDALIAAAKELENYVADCDANEPDTACPVHDIRALYEKGLLSLRTCNCLLRSGFKTMEAVVERMDNLAMLEGIRSMGPHSKNELCNSQKKAKRFHPSGRKTIGF